MAMPLTGEALIRVQSDVSGALGGLNSLTTSLKNAGAATDTLKTKTATGVGEFKRLGGTVGEVVQRMTGLSLGAVGVAGGIALVGKSIIDATRESMKYSLAVGDLSTKLGISAQEASKFYQIADDLRISTQSLELGFRMLTRNGIQPNTENIMRLANEYNAIVDPVQKAQFAMDKFGARAGLEMARMLDAGSDSIGRMADEAEQFGLVVDEKAVATAKKFYENLDKLKDRLEGVKIALGGGIMQALVENGEAMEAGAKQADLRRQAYQQLVDEGITPTVQAVSVLAAELKREAEAAARAEYGTGQLFGDSIRQLKGDLLALPPALSAAAQAFYDQTAATVEGYLKNLEYKAGVDDIAAAIAALRDKNVVINVTTVTEEVTRQTWEWRTGLNTAGGGGGSTHGTQQAQGGKLADVAEVGEEGTEGIINGRVIPHGQWEQMKRAGVVATRRMALGGDVEDVTTYGTWPTLAPKTPGLVSKDISDLPSYSGSVFDDGGGSTSATIAATAQATASAAAEAAAVSVATAMPQAIGQAVSQQTAQQVQIQVASNAAQTNELRAIRRQLKMNNETIVRAVRDAVASL
jgi:hypothetical protein